MAIFTGRKDSGGGTKSVPQLDILSTVLKAFRWHENNALRNRISCKCMK